MGAATLAHPCQNASHSTGATLLAVKRKRRDLTRVTGVSAERARVHYHVVELIFRTRFNHRGTRRAPAKDECTSL